MEYKPPTREIESLLELCQISLDPETNGYELQRFFQVTLWVDGPDRKTTRQEFDRFKSLVVAELSENNCSRVSGVEWGPFEGSRFGSFFGRSNDEPDGRSFKARLKRIAEGVRSKFGKLSTGTKVLLIVGGTAITIVGGPAPAALLFHVPILVTKAIAIAGSVVSAGTQLKKIFEKNPPSTSLPPESPKPPQPSPAKIISNEDEESKKQSKLSEDNQRKLKDFQTKRPKPKLKGK